MTLGPSLEAALQRARREEDVQGAMLCCLGLAVIDMRRGEGADCDRWLDLGLSLGDHEIDPERWFTLLNFRAQRFLSEGLLLKALEPLAAVLQRGGEVPKGQRAQALGNLASVLGLLGDPKAGRAYSQEALRLTRSMGPDSPIGQLLPLQAAALLEQDLPGGEALIGETRELLPSQCGPRRRRITALLTRAEAWLALRQGDPERALELAQEAHELLSSWEDGEELSSCREVAARALLALGRLEDAAEAAELCSREAESVAGEAVPRRILRLQSEIARSRGDTETLVRIVDRLTDPGWTTRKGHPTQAVWELVRRHAGTSVARNNELAAVNRSLRRAMDSAEAAREHAQSLARSRLSFLAQVSHELRTPLQGVLGTVELLGDEPLSPEGHELVRILGDSAELTLGVVDEVLDLSKLEAGALSLEREPFELRPALDEVLAGQRARAADFDLVLVLSMSPRVPPVVVGDRQRLQQLLLNLVGNAIKYARTRVVLEVQHQTEGLVFLVRDDGPGIPAAQHATLFEPFVQAGLSKRTGGTGLGLAICKGLASRLGGSVGLDSSGEGGACFRVELPLPPGQLPTPVQGPLRDLSGIEVVLAEDHAVNRMVLTRQLERMGASVQAVANGSLVQELRGDLYLLDFHMPVMNGPEAARALREAGVDARILALTASVMEEDHQVCARAGMDGVLTKPLSGERLLEMLNELGAGGRDAAAGQAGFRS